jgi:hypothetical protein
MPPQSGVAQCASDQPLLQLQAAAPPAVLQLPWSLHWKPLQVGVPHSAPDQFGSQTQATTPLPVPQLP